MARALWTPEARADLKAIALYIGREHGRPATATKIAREIKSKGDD
jgi:plasmid stabilization system protein ParE